MWELSGQRLICFVCVLLKDAEDRTRRKDIVELTISTKGNMEPPKHLGL
jgi:hypothetical protein